MVTLMHISEVMMIDLSSRISRNPDAVYAQIDTDLVIMQPTDSSFYGINAVGQEIWSLLQSTTLSVSEISACILQKYDVTESQCLDDIKKFISVMCEKNFLISVS